MKKKIKALISGVCLFALSLQLPGITVFAHAETLGERMQTAAYNAVLGIGTVFAMLIVIALIIYAFRIIPMLQKLFSKKKEETAVSEQESKEETVSDINEADDLELVAVIAAAIASYEQVPMDSFRVRTIKRRNM